MNIPMYKIEHIAIAQNCWDYLLQIRLDCSKSVKVFTLLKLNRVPQKFTEIIFLQQSSISIADQSGKYTYPLRIRVEYQD